MNTVIYIPFRNFTNKYIEAATIMMPKATRAIAIPTITGTGTAIFPTEVEDTSLFLKKEKKETIY